MPEKIRGIHLQAAKRMGLEFKRAVAFTGLLAALAASLAAAPADKRKPGLYWTLETDKGKICLQAVSKRKRPSPCARWWAWQSGKFLSCTRKRSR